MSTIDIQHGRTRRRPWLAAAGAAGLAAGIATGSYIGADPSHRASDGRERIVSGSVSGRTARRTRRCSREQKPIPYTVTTVRAAVDPRNGQIKVLRGSDGADASAGGDPWAEIDPRLRPEAFETTMEALLDDHGIENGYIDCQGFPCFVAIPGTRDSEPIEALRAAALEAFGPGIVDHVGQGFGDTGSVTTLSFLPEDVPISSVRRALLERITAVSMFLGPHAGRDGANEGGQR